MWKILQIVFLRFDMCARFSYSVIGPKRAPPRLAESEKLNAQTCVTQFLLSAWFLHIFPPFFGISVVVVAAGRQWSI